MRVFLLKAAKAVFRIAFSLVIAAIILLCGLRLGGYIASEHARSVATQRFAAHRGAFEQTLSATQKTEGVKKPKSIDIPEELQTAGVSGIYVSDGYVNFTFERGVSPFIGQGIFHIWDMDEIAHWYQLYPIDGDWYYYQYSSI